LYGMFAVMILSISCACLSDLPIGIWDREGRWWCSTSWTSRYSSGTAGGPWAAYGDH